MVMAAGIPCHVTVVVCPVSPPPVWARIVSVPETVPT